MSPPRCRRVLLAGLARCGATGSVDDSASGGRPPLNLNGEACSCAGGCGEGAGKTCVEEGCHLGSTLPLPGGVIHGCGGDECELMFGGIRRVGGEAN
jgi:hypothetical protein